METTFSIMVLNDGSTYSSVAGCRILVLTKEAFDLLENGEVEIHDLEHDSRKYVRHLIEFSGD